MMRKLMYFVLLFLLIFLFAGCAPAEDEEPLDVDDVTEEDEEAVVEDDLDQEGGILKVAEIGDPPSLDIQRETSVTARSIGWHIYETLVTFDDDFNIIPMLAEDFDISPDGKTYTFYLREGVLFHNNKEMVAADVMASLERASKFSGYLGPVFEDLESMEAPDDYTVVLEFSEPVGILLELMASLLPAVAIYPEEIVEQYGEDVVDEHIGTGPFVFDEWVRDSYIRLKRFDDYSVRDEAPDGYGGSRKAYVDQIDFMIVPDASVRATGVQTGDYHIARNIHPAEYEMLTGIPNVEVVKAAPNKLTLSMNSKEGIMSNKLIRRAFLEALDMGPLMESAFGHPDLYRLNSGLMWPETEWYTEVGTERYSMGDPETASQTLEEAGYEGEPIRWMVTREYHHHYHSAVVAVDQLEEAGFNIDLQTMDWASIAESRQNPEMWEVFTMNSTYRVGAYMHAYLREGWFTGWANEEKDQLVEQMQTEPDPDKALELYGKVQELVYEEVPVIKIGDFFDLFLVGENVEDFMGRPEPFYWNVWLNEQ